MIKKYKEKKNIAGPLIKESRKKVHMTKAELCKKLELQGVYINRDELLLMEKNQLMIKDFEMVAISKILDIDLNKLKSFLED